MNVITEINAHNLADEIEQFPDKQYRGAELKPLVDWIRFTEDRIKSWDKKLESIADKSAIVRKRLDTITELSDISNLFDGHDELNEHTHQANEKHLASILNRIHKIVTGEEAPE